MRSAQVRAL